MMSPSFVDETRRHYLAALLAHAGTLRLPLRSMEHTFALQQVYQPLTLRQSPPSFEPSSQAAVGVTTARNGAEALSHSILQRMVILGGPGMGKTTLLKALLQQAIQVAQRDPTAPMPLFISLPDLARSGLTLLSYLTGLLRGLGIDARYGDILQQAVTTGQAFLCLDSLDEVVPAQRPAMITLINHEAVRCGGTWIIGSRFTEYKGGQFLHSQFAEWELQPLDDTLQLEMASHLLSLLSERLLRTPAPEAQDFIDALKHDARLAAWGENPLLLSLTAIVYVQAGMLPSSRAMLYRDSISIMLSARTPDPQAQAALRTILAEIALQLYQTQGRNFSAAELFEILRASDSTRSFQEQTALVEQILASGLLDVVSNQTYGFQHQMFQEYLTAVALAEQLCSEDAATHQTAWEFLWRKHTYSRWCEVLQLCVGVLVQEHGEPGSQIAAHWLRRLADEHTTPAGDVGHLCLELAIGSLREFTFTHTHGELVQTVRTLILLWAQTYLKAPDSYGYSYDMRQRMERQAEDVKILDYHLVLPTIIWLEEVRDEKHLEFYDVRRNFSSHFHDLFATWCNIPARVLEHAFPNSQGISLTASRLADTLRTSASMEALVDLLQDTQEPWRIRVSAAELLGEWGERTPIGVLSAIAVDPACDNLIRIAAVEALGKQQERIPLEPLILLLHDPDERVRISAVTALAATGERLPVIPFLTAVHDSQNVRDAVIQSAERLAGQVASEPLLHALYDENGEVRWMAVTLLGSNIPRDRLVAILHDSDGRVRCAAITLLGRDIPLDFLVAALHDSEEKVCLAAITHLGTDIPLESLLMVLHESIGGMSHGLNAVDIAVEIAGVFGDRVPLASLLEVLLRHDGTEDLPHTYTGLDPVEYQPDALWYKVMLVILQSGRTVPLATLIALAQEPNMLARVFEIAIHFHIALPVDLLLTGLFQTDDQTISNRATSMLGSLGESAPMMALLDMACNPLADVKKRLAATGVLLELAPSVPTEPIFAALEELDVTSRLYQDLVHLLVKCGASVKVDVLLKALDRDLAYLFVRDGVPVKVDVLLEALDSPERALIHLGAQAPIEELLSMLRDDPQHESYLANYYDSNDSAREVLEHLFEIISVQHLQTAARHGIEDEHMALKVLGGMGKHAPIDLIKSILDDQHRDRWLRRQARLTLHKAGVLLPLHYFFAENGLSRKLVDYDFSTESYYPTELMTKDEVTIAQMRELGPHAPLKDLFAFFDAPYHDRDDYGEPVPETVVEVMNELAPYLSLEEVVALLDHRNPLARRGAARILSTFAERAPINKLVVMLQNPEENYRVRFTIVQTLSELHAYTPVETLTTLLLDPDVSCDYIFASHICRALKPWGKNIPLEPLLALINSTDSKVDPRPAISALGWLQERAPLDLLLKLLQNDDYFESDYALLALCSLGKAIPLDIVMPHLPGKTNLMGSDYVQAFVAMGEDLPLARFFQIVNDQDADARTWVIKVLGDFAEAAPVQFVTLAKDDVRPFVRVALMKALAKLGQDAPAELALAALTDPHPDVRRQARIALLQLPVDPTLIPLEPLLAALQEKSVLQEPGYYRYESNRHMSELALLAICGARVPVAPLLALLGDLDPDVCENAASTLYQTHPEAFGEVAQQAEAILRGAPAAGVFASRVQSRIARRVSLIEHATPEVLALLSDLLDWPYWQVRVEAATTLANIHRNIPDRAIQRLLKLRLDPASQAVREAVDHALAEILSRENGMEDE